MLTHERASSRNNSISRISSEATTLVVYDLREGLRRISTHALDTMVTSFVLSPSITN